MVMVGSAAEDISNIAQQFVPFKIFQLFCCVMLYISPWWRATRARSTAGTPHHSAARARGGFSHIHIYIYGRVVTFICIHIYISQFKLSLLFEIFPEKYKKKLVTYFWNTYHHRKVKKSNYPQNIQLFSRAKRPNPKKYFRPKTRAENGQNKTFFFRYNFSQTFSPGLEPFMTNILFIDFFKAI